MSAITKTSPTVELFYSGAWHDITLFVYSRDPITITRGRANEVSRIPPSTLNLSIKNPDGRFSWRLPTSALYGLIGRNTPIRVSVAGSVRFVGEVESWPQQWNITGSDVWAPITANGITRRLNAPGTSAPEQSALRRAMLVGGLSAGLLAYWPMEEGATATEAASAVDGVGPLVYTSAVKPGAVTDPQAGSLPYAVVDSTGVAFPAVALPASAAGFVAWSGVFKGTMPRPGSAKAVMYQPVIIPFNGGTINSFRVTAYAKWTGTAFDASNTGVDVLLLPNAGDSFGSVIGGVGTFNLFDGNPHDVQVRLAQSGSNVVGELWIDGVLADTQTSAGAQTLGTAAQLQGPAGVTGTLGGTAVDNADTTLGFGHYGVHTNASVSVPHVVALAHVGEAAADRINRLCAEEGIALSITGDPAQTEPVGVQRVAPLIELFNDASDADDGILYEWRQAFGFVYRTHRSLYNQTAVLTLNYEAGGEVAPPLFPVEDTDATANDVTVTRYQGSSSRLIQATGPLNVQEPGTNPNAVGRYKKDQTLVLAADGQTFQQAAWKRHVGTWDEARYPTVTIDLTAMAVDGKTALAVNAATLDIGDRFVITHPPAWLPPDDIGLLAQGFVETIESHHRSIVVNATPAGPYDIAVLDDLTFGRLDNDACTLAEDLDTTETGVDVTSINTPWGSQFPYDINIGGERMTVTARSGAGLSQTLTVVRSVNGIVKSHTSGAVVQLWAPARLAR